MKKNRNKSLPGGLWLIKNRLMMRMTIVLLLFSSFTAVAQNVTVKMKNSSFIQVAKEIQKQTELTFLYNDAKVGNIAVTPRNGKAVEINAMWYNANMIMANLTLLIGDLLQIKKYKDLAKKCNHP